MKKSIVITGSTRGIGLNMAREFLMSEFPTPASLRQTHTHDQVYHPLAGFSILG